jgi:hypothetical protein
MGYAMTTEDSNSGSFGEVESLWEFGRGMVSGAIVLNRHGQFNVTGRDGCATKTTSDADFGYSSAALTACGYNGRMMVRRAFEEILRQVPQFCGIPSRDGTQDDG